MNQKTSSPASNTPNSQLTVDAAYAKAVEHFGAQQFKEADQLCTAIIQAAPNHIDALNLLGVIAQQINRNDLAVEQFEKAINIDSSFALLHYNLGLSLLQLGKNNEGITSLQNAIAIQPSYYEACNSLGFAMQNQGSLDEAVVYLEKAIAIKPDFYEAYNNLGNTFLAQGELEKAEGSYHKSLSINSNYHEALNNLGNALLAQGKLDEAIESYKQAISINSNYVEALSNLGNALQELGKLDEAIKSYTKAVDINPDFAEAYFNLGNIKSLQNKLDEAIIFYRKAIAIKPGFVEVYGNLGNLLNDQGKFDEAIEVYQQAMAIDPEFLNVYASITGIKSYTSALEIQKLQTLLANSTTNKDKSLLNFTIGKAMLGAENGSDAIKYYLEGNRIHRATFNYDIADTKKTFNSFIKHFDKKFFKTRRGFGAEDGTPIFILGMPRSGSTLIEQILASHPDVYGAGELSFFEDGLLQSLAVKSVGNIPKKALALSLNDTKKLGSKYIENIRKIEGNSKYIIDKMPSNFLYIGMIRLLLPNAKIIHSVRSPQDTCFSIFRENFIHFHPFAYNLTELGQYYRLYSKIMAHWHNLFPGAIYDIHYEKLTSNQEEETKKLLKYCDLGWNDNCLQFYKTARNVRTSSNFQVRQPMYTSSVNGWKRFEKQLQPLVDALGDLASTP
ncbi:MAG: tetratricopeptide repeat protein [Magnetococcales bacterium]|nr:tetratricopeptide repeat protein [Magnetococcales bacterium]